MSIASKQIFLKDIEAELGRILTAETLSKVMPAVSCVLGSFEVEQTSQGGAGSEDLLRAFIDAKQVEGRSRKTLERMPTSSGICWSIPARRRSRLTSITYVPT